MKRKVLVWLLTACLVLTMMPMLSFAETSNGEAPALPTATVTEIEKDGLTFAMNFKADEATDEQLAYYGDWFADFELTVNKEVTFNSDGSADGYLSGFYSNWSENWVNVPFEAVTLKAGETIRIMETASKLQNESGLRYTYAEAYDVVKDFSCGVFFDEEFMDANPDLKVTLELKMYNPKNEAESHVIGETYTFPKVKAPKLPTATITDLGNTDLTFAMNFKADEATEEQLAYYGEWFADFELKVNQDVTFNANGGADGYLSGQYDAWSENWVSVPFEDVTLNANEALKIMDYASKQMNQSGLKLTYNDVYDFVKDFDCGVYFEDKFLRNLEDDLVVTLELRIYNPADEKESYVIGKTYEFYYGKMPTATITETDIEDLTFSMNFKADEASKATQETYKNWYADFVLTANQDITFNANGGADGYLSGQYDAWSENWVNVPGEDVTLKADESLKIMEYAASLMGQSGLKLTYNDVYSFVKDFDCGVFLEPEFLANLEKDLKITLELRMFNPANEKESYAIGETYEFYYGKKPTATVTEIENDELTFALNFKADPVSEATLETYRDWYADFEITTNKEVTFNNDGNADGWLSGQYDEWSENWVTVPFEDVTLEANETLKIMEYAASLMGQPGLKYTYGEVYEVVKDFDCGVFFDEEFIAANKDLVVKLELRMYNPEENSDESYTVGKTYYFTLDPDAVAVNIQTGKIYSDVNVGLGEATDGQTVALLKNVETSMVMVPEYITLDLDGYNLKTGYMSSFGDIIDSSNDNASVLTVPASRFLIQTDNDQLTVKDGNNGYKLVDITKFNQLALADRTQYVFQPLFEGAAVTPLLAGKASSGVTINVDVEWFKDGSPRNTTFEYADSLVDTYLNSYKPANGAYGKMLYLNLYNVENIPDYTFKTIVRSDTGVEFVSDAI